MHTYQIPANMLKAVALASSNEETRYYLKGVYLEPRDAHIHLTATNGHVLISLRLPTPDDTPATGEAFIIPAHLIAQLKIPKRGEAVSTVTINDEKLVTIALEGASFAAPAVDGSFPDYARVIPESVDGETAYFNPDLLLKFKKAAELLGEKIVAPSIGYNGLGPAFVTISTTLDAIGVAMPVRSSKPVTSAPDWLKRPGFAEAVSKLEAAE